MTRLKTNPKSNTWMVLVPFVLWLVGSIAYISLLQEESQGRYASLMAAGVSVPFFATAVAQLRSGYLWRNLAPGNRGAHRSESPKSFFFSTIFLFVIGLAIVAVFVVGFIKYQGQEG